jgi:uncharacterized protein YdeI (YjbR/CyaY-like superfamily)
MPQKSTPDYPILLFATAQEWENWLADNFAQAAGVWLRFYKKGSGLVSINYTQALDVALCYGWIDSQVKKGDTQSYLQKFTPRKARSIWSQVNQEKVARLIESERMQPAGLAEIAKAKANGQWEQAYASFSQMEVPPDLAAELNQWPDAKAFFESLTKTQRYSLMFPISTAKKPETRLRRLHKALELLKQGKKPS